MGLNSCVCLRNLDELSAETGLNGDGEIEGFKFPNNNNNQINSNTDYSSKFTGAGKMSYLMKVNSFDSNIIKNSTFYNLKAVPAAEKIQSIFRGCNFRKKFFKQNENFNNNEIEKNQQKNISKIEKNKSNSICNILNIDKNNNIKKINKSEKKENANSIKNNITDNNINNYNYNEMIENFKIEYVK